MAEDGSAQLLQRNSSSQKASTVCIPLPLSELLGTSQKCLNMHFFAGAAPPETSLSCKVDWGVSQARLTIPFTDHRHCASFS